VGSGGKLNIDSGSGLVIRPGAVLELQAGAQVRVFGHGYIHIESGGTLILHGGAGVWLEQQMPAWMNYESKYVGSVIRLEGALHAVSGIINMNGDGYLWIREGHSFTTGTGSLRWQHASKSHTSYRVDAPVTLQGINFGIEHAKVMVNKAIHVNGGDYADIVNAVLHSAQVYILGSSLYDKYLLKLYNEIVISYTGVPEVHISRSTFMDVPVHTKAYSLLAVEGANSMTERKLANFVCESGQKLLFSATTVSTSGTGWIGNDILRISKIGVWSKQVYESKYEGCHFWIS